MTSETRREGRGCDVGAVERRGADDDGAVEVVALAEAAVQAAEAFAIELDLRAHAVEGFDVAEALFVDGLVDDADAGGLGERDDEGLLPVGHEAGVDMV